MFLKSPKRTFPFHGFWTYFHQHFRSFTHKWLINRFITRQVPLVEQELLTLPEHLSSPRSLILCVMFCRSWFILFVLFLLAIVLSVLLHIMDSDYPFGVYKLFFLSILALFLSKTLIIMTTKSHCKLPSCRYIAKLLMSYI